MFFLGLMGSPINPPFEFKCSFSLNQIGKLAMQASLLIWNLTIVWKKKSICHQTEMSKCLVWVTKKNFIQTAKFTLLPTKYFFRAAFATVSKNLTKEACLIRWWEVQWCQMWKLHIKWNPSRWIVSLQLSTQITSPKNKAAHMGKKKTSTKLYWNSGFRPLLFNRYNEGESQENGNKRFRAASDTFKRLTVETCTYIYIS